ELAPEPGASIERLDLLQRMIPHPASAVGGALECLVVDHDHGAVAGDLAIELNHIGAELDRAQKRRAGVLRAVPRGAAVSDAQHSGPVGHRRNSSGERAPLSVAPVGRDVASDRLSYLV